MSVQRVFIANRGEIAVRIVRACHELGLEAIAAYSEADKGGLSVKMADGAECVGGSRSLTSYLAIENIIKAAKDAGCDALHPGYGFLAESPVLARRCAESNITFIGPQAHVVERMGNKLEAREAVSKWGVPVAPGSSEVRDWEEARQIGDTIGYPIMVKAAAGGGGRGIKVIRGKLEVEESFKTASAEALAAFGDGALFVEKYIEDGRHIEVQILGDAKGNVVHLGERDCSLQRRYQKVAEEATGSAISQSVRELIRESAVKISKNIGYQNAGTVEFMVDQKTGKFYFLEMNTRIQVEHPVTEMVTGVDLVQAQIKIAGGSPIPFHQEEVRFVGHAIEVRITAENAANSFRPSPGIIAKWRPAGGYGVRVDTYGYQGALVPPYYDSLIAKLIVHAPSRVHAIMKMQRALSDFEVEGIDTTIPFLRRLVSELDFVQGNYNTRWLELNLDTLTR